MAPKLRVTTGCSAFGHPEFELDVDGVPDVLTSFVVRYVEGRVAKGARFEPGQHAQFGSGVLRVATAGNRLTFFECAPGTDDWQRGFGTTLVAMYRQRCTLESIGLLERLDYPAPCAGAIVCKRVDSASAVGFIRDEPTGDDSGWSVVCAEDHDHADADELLSTRIETVIARVPLFELFLAMPAGSLVARGPRGIESIHVDDVVQPILVGSFLEMLGRERRWPVLANRN